MKLVGTIKKAFAKQSGSTLRGTLLIEVDGKDLWLSSKAILNSKVVNGKSFTTGKELPVKDGYKVEVEYEVNGNFKNYTTIIILDQKSEDNKAATLVTDASNAPEAPKSTSGKAAPKGNTTGAGKPKASQNASESVYCRVKKVSGNVVTVVKLEKSDETGEPFDLTLGEGIELLINARATLIVKDKVVTEIKKLYDKGGVKNEWEEDVLIVSPLKQTGYMSKDRQLKVSLGNITNVAFELHKHFNTKKSVTCVMETAESLFHAVENVRSKLVDKYKDVLHDTDTAAKLGAALTNAIPFIPEFKDGGFEELLFIAEAIVDQQVKLELKIKGLSVEEKESVVAVVEPPKQTIEAEASVIDSPEPQEEPEDLPWDTTESSKDEAQEVADTPDDNFVDVPEPFDFDDDSIPF